MLLCTITLEKYANKTITLSDQQKTGSYFIACQSPDDCTIFLNEIMKWGKFVTHPVFIPTLTVTISNSIIHTISIKVGII